MASRIDRVVTPASSENFDGFVHLKDINHSNSLNLLIDPRATSTWSTTRKLNFPIIELKSFIENSKLFFSESLKLKFCSVWIIGPIKDRRRRIFTNPKTVLLHRIVCYTKAKLFYSSQTHRIFRLILKRKQKKKFDHWNENSIEYFRFDSLIRYSNGWYRREIQRSFAFVRKIEKWMESKTAQCR